jgi:hypothetical protein
VSALEPDLQTESVRRWRLPAAKPIEALPDHVDEAFATP